MQVVDEQGNVFGRINVIDLLATLLFVSLLIAGSTFVLQSDAQAGAPADETTTAVIVQTSVPPYVAEEVSTGPVLADDIRAVTEITEVETLELATPDPYGAETHHRLHLRLQLLTERDEDGLLRFRDDRLYVGRTLQVDLGSTIVETVVIDVVPE